MTMLVSGNEKSQSQRVQHSLTSKKNKGGPRDCKYPLSKKKRKWWSERLQVPPQQKKKGSGGPRECCCSMAMMMCGEKEQEEGGRMVQISKIDTELNKCRG